MKEHLAVSFRAKSRPIELSSRLSAFKHCHMSPLRLYHARLHDFTFSNRRNGFRTRSRCSLAVCTNEEPSIPGSCTTRRHRLNMSHFDAKTNIASSVFRSRSLCRQDKGSAHICLATSSIGLSAVHLPSTFILALFFLLCGQQVLSQQVCHREWRMNEAVLNQIEKS